MADVLDEVRCITYDFEVFAHDWLCVLKVKDSGEVSSFWNDSVGLMEYMERYEDSLFFGFNSSGYDQYIMKAISAGCTPEEVKQVNDFIVGSFDRQPWQHPFLRGVWYSFNDIDLMKDCQVGTSLKSIEGHMGWNIEESSVTFDIDRPLTSDERDEVYRYCLWDVTCTERLIDMRRKYLLTKYKLGLRADMPINKSMALTNAKLTARILNATMAEHDDERRYVYPDNLLREYIPQEVFDYFDRMYDPSVSDEELFKGKKLEISIGGCPATVAFGGLHAAIPSFDFHADGQRRVINADVSSYYPSLMIKNAYISRNIPSPQVFIDTYEERLDAKHIGDKDTAECLKTPVNTTYGATLNPYNDLYDPLMARSVCISGQLYLLELAEHCLRDIEGLQIVQLNTDGIMVNCPVEGEDAFREICREWQERTQFELEFDDIALIAQKDVNNYAMRTTDGHDKLKGGWLVRGESHVGAYKVNNDAIIVAEAIAAYLLDDVPVEETIAACNDPFKFQLIAKASHKYGRVYQPVDGVEEERQKCNRVFASRDTRLGRLYKVKAEDGQVEMINDLPDHCLISNRGMPEMGEIDKSWYVELARKRAGSFGKGGEMAVAKKTESTVDNSQLNVYAKLALARKRFIEAGVKKSGINKHLEYDYFTLEDIVPTQTAIFAELGLIELTTFVPKRKDVHGYNADTLVWDDVPALAKTVIVNADKPEETIEFVLPWVDMPEKVTKDGKVLNNRIQEMGGVQTYLRRYLKMQVLDIVEFDEMDGGAGAPEATTEEVGADVEVTVSDKPKRRSKPATEAERKDTAEKLTDADGAATAFQLTQLKKQVKRMREKYPDNTEVADLIANISVESDNLKSVTKSQCEGYIQSLGALRETIEGGK